MAIASAKPSPSEMNSASDKIPLACALSRRAKLIASMFVAASRNVGSFSGCLPSLTKYDKEPNVLGGSGTSNAAQYINDQTC